MARKFALLAILAAGNWLAAGQTAPSTPTTGQDPQNTSQPGPVDPDAIQAGESAQNHPAGNQPDQSAEQDASGEVRVAPAAALSARAGLESGEDTNLELPQLPSLLGGRGTTLAFPAEIERSNFVRGGVNVGAAYDDNPLLEPSQPVGNVSGSVFPSLSIEEKTSRTSWLLGYAGGLTVNQRFTSQDQGSHDLNFDSLFRLSRHVNLRVAENFLMTTGVFDAGAGGPETGGAGAPNASLLVPLATERSSLTTVETNYHFALNDLVGASGSFYDLRFSNLPAGEQLSDLQTASETGFWLHRFFPGNWGGASYRFQRMTYDPNGEARVQDFLAVDTLELPNHISLNGFVGPEYTVTQGVMPGGTAFTQSNQWSVAGGAGAGWRDAKTSLSAGYSRMTSDGAGVLGAVRLQSVNAALRREIWKGWAGKATVSRGTNHSLTVPYAGSASSINLTSAGAGLERNMVKGLGLQLSYTHDFEQLLEPSGSPTPTLQWLNANRNRFAVMLSYQWSKPIGM